MECDKNMSFEDCELAVLRSAVDKIEKQTGRKKIENPEVKEIINVVEDFLILIQSFSEQIISFFLLFFLL